jgi:5-methylcytosine-specific restriction endonuclease McrA
MCEACETTDTTVLVVHHIDEDRQNNSDENLQTLCSNCHHRTHWTDSAMREKQIRLAHLLAQ